MSTTETGRTAEQLAATWLQQQGFRILDRNWRTRWCELDIVAGRRGTFHIIEVKYRRRADFGDSAAAMWLKAHSATEAPCQIDVIAVTGPMRADNVVYLADVGGSNV